ncbi:MAG: hypothetical protein A2293_12130 [Elusimicrobia bacterium RIFOXYB2_FULL_49_7]|nr:MAG: hypothetical protein A2293_12130 [Elusimicrobia bacterium RIFOXYB2_FULL_49_7]
MKPVRIGLVGTRFIAATHMRSFQKMNSASVQVQGAVSGNPENAKVFAAQYGLPKSYNSYDDMLKDPDIDVVDICTPNDLHKDMILTAAQAGKHIICEKPLSGAFGLSSGKEKPGLELPRKLLFDEAVQNAKACVDAVRKAGVGFGYAENYVYSPPVVKMKRLLQKANGTIFDIRADESHSGSHADYTRTWKRSGGGSLLRLGAHPVGVALHLKVWEGRLKQKRPILPVAVMAEIGHHTWMDAFKAEKEKFIKHAWVDVEDWACAIITFEDNSKATVFSSDCTLGGVRNKIEVYSSNAVLVANINPNDTLQVFAPQAGLFKDEYIQEKLETDGGWNFPAPDDEWIRGYDGELTDFIEAFREGREPVSNLALAEDTLKVIYAAYVSAEEGRRIRLK